MTHKFMKIINKASELYKQYGIKSVSMDDIARESGISKKTLYKCFSHKDDLIEGFVHYISQARKCEVDKIVHRKLNAIEEFIGINEHIMDTLKIYNPSTDYDLKKYYPNLYNQLRENRRTKMFQVCKNNLIKGKREQLYRTDLDEDIVARILVSRIENSFANEMFTRHELISWKFAREMMKYHIYGIANEKGIKFFERKLDQMENNREFSRTL
jgi:AcrR family transcriptional regulator